MRSKASSRFCGKRPSFIRRALALFAALVATAAQSSPAREPLHGLEEAVARGCRQERDAACERTFDVKARRRRQAMDHYLWDGKAGWFEGYDWREAKRRGA